MLFEAGVIVMYTYRPVMEVPGWVRSEDHRSLQLSGQSIILTHPCVRSTSAMMDGVACWITFDLGFMTPLQMGQ